MEPPVEEPTKPVLTPLEEVPAEEVPTEELLPVLVVDLHAFYAAVVPFWAMCAYKRLFFIHGIDVTQAGITSPRGQDYEQISDKRRGEILGQIRSKVHFYQSELGTYMRANNFLPKVDACHEAPRKLNIGVFIAKRRR
ncbi:DUF6712 family protein [Rufibacter hautae]|uniref:Uncharacterized protein n=1 Tax=Rufibacter hautae TaxID=2595005 RepID=A0A5B6TF10_9BACT|nr:hypothetical protein [Rufibacter hautae]KAA3438461.1 hypothetical protein FOA19_14595 [Rufibacter hautae]